MYTVYEIQQFIESLAPPETMENWDNSGLLTYSDNGVSSVLVSVDITKEVAKEAAQKHCQLVISHHPVIFQPLRQVRQSSPVWVLAQNGISAYCAHTTFDKAPYGTADALAHWLGLPPGTPFAEYGRICELPQPTALSALMEQWQQKMGHPITYAAPDFDQMVQYVAVATGSGAGLLPHLAAVGADVYITGEMAYHDVHDALAQELPLVLLGHYASEQPGMAWLAQQLRMEFPDLVVLESQVEWEPLVTYCPSNSPKEL